MKDPKEIVRISGEFEKLPIKKKKLVLKAVLQWYREEQKKLPKSKSKK